MLLRIATDTDSEAIRSIYNYEVEHFTNTFDLASRTPEEQQTWMQEHTGVYVALVAVSDSGQSDDLGQSDLEQGDLGQSDLGQSDLGQSDLGQSDYQKTSGYSSNSTSNDTIIGFGSLSPYHKRPGYKGSAEVSVYIHADHQRKGVGKAILLELLEQGKARGFHTLLARVSGANEASSTLFGACGFAEVGREREVGRKFNQWLDCVIFQKML